MSVLEKSRKNAQLLSYYFFLGGRVGLGDYCNHCLFQKRKLQSVNDSFQMKIWHI